MTGVSRPQRAGRGAGGEAELAEEFVGQVHGVLAEHELVADVGVRQSVRDEFE